MSKYPKQILIHVSKETSKRLRKEAKLYQRSLSQWVRMIIDQSFAHQDSAKKSEQTNVAENYAQFLERNGITDVRDRKE
jgi:hypothetical protein